MIMPLGQNSRTGSTRPRQFNEAEDIGLLLIDERRWGHGGPPDRPFISAGVQRFR